MSKLFEFSPFIFLGAYIIVLFFIRGNIPSPEALLASLQAVYGTYGYALIFISGILEATFLLGFYVPGSMVMLFGAALSKTGVLDFPLAYACGLFGLQIGYTLNYILGRYGWYHVLARVGFGKGIEVAKTRLEEYGAKAFLLGYFYPGSASFIATAAGVLRLPFKRFFVMSFLAQAIWGLLWGLLAYFYGLTLIELLLKYSVFVLLAILAFLLAKKI